MPSGLTVVKLILGSLLLMFGLYGVSCLGALCCGREIVLSCWRLRCWSAVAEMLLLLFGDLDSFFLSFWRPVLKLLLRVGLLMAWFTLDDVELGWLFFAGLGESYWCHTVIVPIRCLFVSLGESYIDQFGTLYRRALSESCLDKFFGTLCCSAFSESCLGQVAVGWMG